MRSRKERGKGVANRLAVHAEVERGRRYATLVAQAARRYLESLKVDECEISITLVGDPQIRRLNRIWRKIDRPTDVLSFSAGEMPPGTPGPRQLGDLVISLDTASREAKRRSIAVSSELKQYVAHGLLHLLGHDHAHPAGARRMAKLERKLLGAPGMLEGSNIGIGKNMRLKRK
jgi:probable rRNA maturation factor